MNPENCGNCKCWNRRNSHKNDVAYGICQRYPVQLVPILSHCGTSLDAVERAERYMDEDEWCGEWRAK